VRGMRIDAENVSNSFIGLSITLNDGDLNALIRRLSELKADPSQHFHISTDGNGCFVDISISVDGSLPRNASISGFAIG
jgi:hypothetical protein